MKTPFYSIGIIFKNDIRCLERCLRSLQPLRESIPCEVVMADTGSSDGSREIAEQYADILFDFAWVDDFSAARNAVMDRCSGQWYLSIDTDEWLDPDIGELIQFSKAKKLLGNFGAFRVRNYKSTELEKGKNYVDFTAIRMARLSTGVRYEGCIHEKWPGPQGKKLHAMLLQQTLLHHDGYVYFSEEEAHAKYERNMALLKRKLAENPNDLHTLMECIDSAKIYDEHCVDYVREALEGIRQKWARWQEFAPLVLRGGVFVAERHQLPELEDWIRQAEQEYSDSIFVRVDIAYYAFSHYWQKQMYEECIRWGEIYRQGLSDYLAGRFDQDEMIRGVVEYISPFWERKLLIILSEAYLDTGSPEKAFTTLQDIKGQELDDLKQVESCTHMLLRLHRTARVDTPSLAARFWAQINQPESGEDVARQRREVFLAVANSAFTPQYRREEEEKPDFIRHGCLIFTALEGELGAAAAVMASSDSEVLTQKLSAVEQWDNFSIHALAHALEYGAEFPAPDRIFQIEELDILAGRMAKALEQGYFFQLVRQAAASDFARNQQSLAWIRGLVLAAVHTFDWNAEEPDTEQGICLSRAFAQVEKIFLPYCYTAAVLSREMLFLLPPLHRFGWYLTQAFDALDAGDTAGYVRLLREGLAVCQSAKGMVEFLIDHTPELQAPPPSAELLSLAEQIRMVLSNLAPDDPAAAALKQSEAYQKVAYLIEGAAVPVVGGLLQ